MVRANLLAIEHFGTPHACKLQASGDVFVHQASHVEDGAATAHGERFVGVRRLARRLRIDPDDFQGTIHYSKGSLFLTHLENAFGREDFDRFLFQYFS